MRAAVLDTFGGRPSTAEVEVAAILPQEVRVRVAATGVCHSDRHGQTGGNPALGLPVVLGHEAAGEVLEVGGAVRGVQPGDHVVISPAGSCGTCAWCSRGLPQHCTDLARSRPDGHPPRLSLEGGPLTQFVGIGAFAEEVLVPGSALAVVPRELPWEQAALLGCAVVTGVGAARHTARVGFGDTVAVIGCGGVGLSAIQGALLCGASRVVAVDMVPAKLALASRLGATDTVDASAADPVAAVLDLTGGVDHVLEVVGRPATVEQAFAMLGTRGTATVVGLAHAGDTLSLPSPALLGERRLQGSRLGGTRLRVDVPLYAQMYAAGRLDLDVLLGRTVGLEDVADALDGLDAADTARTVVTF